MIFCPLLTNRVKYRKCEGETGSNYIPFCFLGQYKQIRISKLTNKIFFSLKGITCLIRQKIINWKKVLERN